MTSELVVGELTVRFAGLTALIGPNGAGKSTCFNVLSLVYRASEGSVRFGGAELTSLAPHRIASLGVARTFQNIALSRHQSAEDNLMLGRHRLTRAGFAAAGLRTPRARREEARHRARVRDIAGFVGVDEHLGTPAGTTRSPPASRPAGLHRPAARRPWEPAPQGGAPRFSVPGPGRGSGRPG